LAAGTGRGQIHRAIAGTRHAPKTGETLRRTRARIAAIHAAQEGAEIALGELLHRSDDASTAAEMAELQPEIELARSTINDCTQKEVDLMASLTTISPPDAAIVAKLQSLAASIDAATVKSAIVTATLAGLADVLNSAIRINAML
jgi:hypothetical protein